MDPAQYEKLIADARKHTNEKIEAVKQKSGTELHGVPAIHRR